MDGIHNEALDIVLLIVYNLAASGRPLEDFFTCSMVAAHSGRIVRVHVGREAYDRGTIPVIQGNGRYGR